MTRAVVTALALLIAAAGCDRSDKPAGPLGPPLSVTKARTDSALACPPTFAHPDRPPVLLVHGTASTPEASWSWNLQRSLPAAGWDTCTVRLPNRATGDIQVASEYVVAAVRAMHASTGRKVSIVGHSQGGLEPRWAIRWWPDVGRSVDDVIMLATPNHGLDSNALCPGGSCTAAMHQMRGGSNFLTALNRGREVPAGVSMTSIYSASDPFVQPATGPGATAALRGGANVQVQTICPARPVDHVAILFDATAYALVVDALQSPGPADPARVSRTVCEQASAPGADVTQGTLLFQSDPGLREGVAATVLLEPPLRPYAD